MKLGKLTSEQLQNAVLSHLRHTRNEVVLRPGIGEDCAALNFGNQLCVTSCDPITAAQKDLGRLAVQINCNDAASSGAEPVAMLLTLLVPACTELCQIEAIMHQAQQTAQQLRVEIIGGHTEVTDAVTRPVICATVLAACKHGRLVQTSGAKPGDALILTKTAGLEGTYILAQDFAKRARQILGEADYQACLNLSEQLSVIPEGMIAAKQGATAMHDVTEGGVLGAVHELCTASGCGVTIEEEKIPLLPQTRTLCAQWMLDPLRLISSGCMLIAAPNGWQIVNALTQKGIEATIIGHTCVKGQGMSILCADGQVRPLAPPRTDELYKMYSENDLLV